MKAKQRKPGRPFLTPTTRLESRSFRLLPHEWRELERLGQGDVREGIRRLLAKKNPLANGSAT